MNSYQFIYVVYDNNDSMLLMLHTMHAFLILKGWCTALNAGCNEQVFSPKP